jgi:hypothetical protein
VTLTQSSAADEPGAVVDREGKGQLVLTGFQRMTMVTVLLWVGIDQIRVGYELEKLRPAILMHWAVPKREQFTGLPDVGT